MGDVAPRATYPAPGARLMHAALTVALSASGPAYVAVAEEPLATHGARPE